MDGWAAMMRIGMRTTRTMLLMFLLALGCAEERSIANVPEPARPPPPIAEAGAISDAAAFALVPTGEGALLAWGAASGVRVLVLGPHGEPIQPPQTLDETRVLEVDAAAAGRRVALAWVADTNDAETRAAYSPDGGASFAAIERIGASVSLGRGTRGRLSMAPTEDGALVLYHRLPEGPCVASAGQCALFTRRAIGSETRIERGTEPLEVLHPCDPLVSGATFRNGTWYYAICHVDPEPRTTLYAIRPAIAYATTFASPPSCVPLGIAPLDEGVVFVARCAEGTTAWPLDEMGRERARLTSLDREPVCRGGRPLLRIASGAREHVLHLGQASDHLETLLPERIAPIGARAVWTGEALLVASVERDRLSIHRYQCDGGAHLQRTDR